MEDRRQIVKRAVAQALRVALVEPVHLEEHHPCRQRDQTKQEVLLRGVASCRAVQCHRKAHRQRQAQDVTDRQKTPQVIIPPAISPGHERSRARKLWFVWFDGARLTATEQPLLAIGGHGRGIRHWHNGDHSVRARGRLASEEPANPRTAPPYPSSDMHATRHAKATRCSSDSLSSANIGSDSSSAAHASAWGSSTGRVHAGRCASAACWWAARP